MINENKEYKAKVSQLEDCSKKKEIDLKQVQQDIRKLEAQVKEWKEKYKEMEKHLELYKWVADLSKVEGKKDEEAQIQKMRYKR